MKIRFNTYDIVCAVTELQKLVGLRVNQIYDIDNKTYLIRLQQSETKEVLLIESGLRFHTTSFEWPKNVAPSGFTMKLRKHLKNKRLEKLEQLGVDRIVDFQFGMNEAAYHIIVELYDRGNVILTDHEMTILYILRPHTEGEETRFAIREKYPVNRAKASSEELNEAKIRDLIAKANPGDNLRRILVPILDCGPAVIDHVLLSNDIGNCMIPKNENSEEPEPPQKGGKKGKQRGKDGVPFSVETDIPKLMKAIQEANDFLLEAKTTKPKGFLIQKKEEKPSENNENQEFFYQNLEYHPKLFLQNKDQEFKEFDSFNASVDEFYSTLEGQKIDMKTMHQEREALKKLSNVKKDHAKRLDELTKNQEVDKQKAELITRNQELVDNAILAVRSALANQMSWPDIKHLVKSAQNKGDPVADSIKQLKFEINNISLLLKDPYRIGNPDDEDDEDVDLPTMTVDIDLDLSAWANARKYYDLKRTAAKKEQKTIDASQKALKSAERKTQQTLKDVRMISTISKARKVYWFEKFYWFISSENYLVIGGRDAQQNELIVKRYMRATDIYVHAEIQGASSVIIQNPSGGDVPPKTLLEAGTMAISYSVAWDAKVVTNAYWVKSDQVSKTAPTGEFLGTGSFMIRGKKNFLPPCHLIMGISMLFKLEDSFVEKHKGERKVRNFGEEAEIMGDRLRQIAVENEKLEEVPEVDEEIKLEEDNHDEEIKLEDDHDDNQEEDDNEEKSEDDEKEFNFPDTEVKIEHATGKITLRLDSKTESVSSELTISKKDAEGDDDDKPYIIPAMAPRKKQQQNSKKKKEEKIKQKQKDQEEQKNKMSQNQSQFKRGQKGKLKKMKAKYKDQDEEERELRMQILKSAGSKPQEDPNQNLIENDAEKKKKPHERGSGKPQIDTEDIDDTPAVADIDMIDSLTGVPFEEDELLFAIPIIAPYQALQNYQFKIKLTPGTGKRGKAAKTALLMFSKEKTCTARERDLLKGIKDEMLARNIPGKVKLSAPQLQKFKK